MSFWSEQQQRLLEAMGYVLFVRPSSDSLPKPSDTLLLQALVRATGGVDISDLTIDLDALRREPMQKRLLWPRLRALLRNR